MTDHHQKLHDLLRSALPPVADTELKKDLWPRMLHHLEKRPIQVPWFDWALAGAPLLWLALFPEHIPIVLSLL